MWVYVVEKAKGGCVCVCVCVCDTERERERGEKEKERRNKMFFDMLTDLKQDDLC